MASVGDIRVLHDFECHVSETDYARTLKLNLFKNTGKYTEVASFDSPIITRIEDANPVEVESKPIRININTARKLVSVLSAYLNRNGISIEPESTLRGELWATKKHLADMERLVFERLTHKQGNWEVENVSNKKSN